MKKFILALIAVTVLMIAIIVYEKYFVQSEFGPSTLLAVILLFSFALALTVTLLSFDTKFQELVTRIWMIGISTCITFIVFDLLAGWVLIKPLSPELSPDKIRHHMLVPNTYSRFEQPDFSYIQRVNNIGIRGEDRSLEKPPNHFRILTLGDSFTMGKGVEDLQTFSALLEESLSKQMNCESDKQIEVLNGGVDSYAPVLSYLQLANHLVSTDPDIILLNLDISDLVQETAYRKVAVFDSEGNVVGVPSGKERPVLLNQRIRRWIDQHLFFTRLILFYTNKLVGYKDLSVEGVVTQANNEIVKYTLASDSVDRSDQWDKIFNSISSIKKLADERSISFALVVYPWGHQVNESEWVPGRYTFMEKDDVASDNYLKTVEQLAEKNGVELVNMFPVFRAYKSEKPLYFKYDMHWTTEGHKVMAGGLEDYLLKNFSSRWCS